jgi:hypothetical protein
MNYSNLTAEQQMVAEAKKFVNKKQRELTQAEYNALSTEEKNNGTLYFIIDSENPLIDGYTKSEVDTLLEITSENFNNKVEDIYDVLSETNTRNILKVELDSNVQDGIYYNTYYDGNGDFEKLEIFGTAEKTVSLKVGQVSLKKDCTYTLKGCPAGGSLGSYAMDMGQSGTWLDTGKGAVALADNNEDADISIVIVKNFSISESEPLIFYPQVSYGVNTSSEYSQYAMTNKELTNNKVDKIQGKGLSTNDFTDNYKKGISISQELAYDKSKEYIPSSDADFHNVGDGEIFTKDGITYGIHSIIQNPKTKEYIYTLSYSGHSTHGYAFAVVKDPTSNRDDWNILKPSGIVAHQIPCVSERFDGYVRFYSVYVDTSGEEQVSTLIYSDDLYEWSEMDVENASIRLYQMGNNAFCYTDKLYKIDDLQILPTDLPYEPLKIAYGGGRLVVLTSNRSIYMSYDGIQWELMGTTIYSGEIIYGNGIFLIYSYEEDTVYVSKDGGYIWETQSVTVYNGDNVNPAEREVYEYYFPFREIGYAGGIFFGTTGYHKQGQSLSEDLYGIWTSKDGYNWEITVTDIEEEYKVTDNLYNETYIINTKNNLYYPTLSVSDAIDTKVDKVSGKGLSTNDYTDAEKQKNADNASAIEDLQEDISQSLSATGNPLTIEASESNLVECVAEVEAVQDLHGYDHPWVGGAGKNLYVGSPSFQGYSSNGTWESVLEQYNGHPVMKQTAKAWGGLYKRIYLENGTYTFSAMVKTSSSARVFLFALGTPDAATISPENSEAYTIGTSWTRISFSFQVTTAGYLALRPEAETNVDLYVSEYQLEKNSSATVYEPYTNISPITGQTEVVLDDVGKNWLNSDDVQNKSVYVDSSNRVICANDNTRLIACVKVYSGKSYVYS